MRVRFSIMSRFFYKRKSVANMILVQVKQRRWKKLIMKLEKVWVLYPVTENFSHPDFKQLMKWVTWKKNACFPTFFITLFSQFNSTIFLFSRIHFLEQCRSLRPLCSSSAPSSSALCSSSVMDFHSWFIQGSSMIHPWFIESYTDNISMFIEWYSSLRM